MDENTIWDYISYYDEEYAKEIGLDKLDDEDVRNILFNIMNNNEVVRIIHEEIEDYVSRKNN